MNVYQIDSEKQKFTSRLRIAAYMLHFRLGVTEIVFTGYMSGWIGIGEKEKGIGLLVDCYCKWS